VAKTNAPEVPTVVPSITPRLLSVPLAAIYLSGTNWYVEEILRSGELPYRVSGKGRVIDIADLDAWIDKQPKQTGRMPAPKLSSKRAAA
jgi:hypothetical protein